MSFLSNSSNNTSPDREPIVSTNDDDLLTPRASANDLTGGTDSFYRQGSNAETTGLPEGASALITPRVSGTTIVLDNAPPEAQFFDELSPLQFFNNTDSKAVAEGHERHGNYEYQDIYKSFYMPRPLPDADLPLSKQLKQIQDLQRLFPNLRDLAASSNHDNIKPGMLFRSARPFVENVHELSDVMIGYLDIRTVLDLRPVEIASNRCEHSAREMELMISTPLPTSARPKDQATYQKLIRLQQKGERKVLVQIQNHERRCFFEKEKLTNYLRNGRWDDDERYKPTKTDAHRDLVQIDATLRCCAEARRLMDRIRDGRTGRHFHVVNFLDTPEVHSRVSTQLGQPDSWHTVPFLAACKIGDKIMKTNNAEFYFSKFFIAGADVEESYIEMLQACQAPILDCLKLCLFSMPPILFHCTLGKDRTGILAMLLLHILGASESSIMFDYALTSYADDAFQAFMKKFIVDQSGLSDKFTGATVEIMRGVLDWIREAYGSVDNYLDSIGCDVAMRQGIREKFLFDPLKLRPNSITSVNRVPSRTTNTYREGQRQLPTNTSNSRSDAFVSDRRVRKMGSRTTQEASSSKKQILIQAPADRGTLLD